jgi:hypothetical protein
VEEVFPAAKESPVSAVSRRESYRIVWICMTKERKKLFEKLVFIYIFR